MNQYVITIGRQFGSGGRSIAEKLAKKLDIKFYDKDLFIFNTVFTQKREIKNTCRRFLLGRT